MNLDKLCDGLGGALHPEYRERLLRVLQCPTQETWNEAYTILIGKHTTLWNAVVAVDKSFNIAKPAGAPWPRIPTQFTLYRAIKNLKKGDT